MKLIITIKESTKENETDSPESRILESRVKNIRKNISIYCNKNISIFQLGLKARTLSWASEF